MRPCPENKWPLSPALQNAWESLDYKANIGPVTNKEDSDQPAYPPLSESCVFASIIYEFWECRHWTVCRCTSYPLSFFAGVGGGVGQGTLFLWRGEGVGGRVHSAQGTTQFVDHKLTCIIQKELQSLIKYFVRSWSFPFFFFVCQLQHQYKLKLKQNIAWSMSNWLSKLSLKPDIFT